MGKRTAIFPKKLLRFVEDEGDSVKEIGKEKLIRAKLSEGKSSPVKMYRSMTTGEKGWGYFLAYELLTCILGPMPGALGLFLRQKLYPFLFRKSGKGLVIGRNVVIRNPQNMIIGNHVTIDDNCLLDARGGGLEGLVLGDEVIINRNCIVLAKTGPIHLGSRTCVGSNSALVSIDGLTTGESVLMAGGCSLSGGTYRFDAPGIPVMDQATYSKGPIRIGSGAWLGSSALILDGIRIGSGAVIGAGAVVTKDVPDRGVAVGVPARLLKII
jgi:acetyltransferase-like isoleucine patch superfamily enzyme